MIFKRYSSPFILIDELIESNQFNDFIPTIINNRNDDLLFEVWLHKVYDKSFTEFKESVDTSELAQTEALTEDEIKTTINKSKEMLSDFKPQ